MNKQSVCPSAHSFQSFIRSQYSQAPLLHMEQPALMSQCRLCRAAFLRRQLLRRAAQLHEDNVTILHVILFNIMTPVSSSSSVRRLLVSRSLVQRCKNITREQGDKKTNDRMTFSHTFISSLFFSVNRDSPSICVSLRQLLPYKR